MKLSCTVHTWSIHTRSSKQERRPGVVLDWKWNQVKWCLALHKNRETIQDFGLCCVCIWLWSILCRITCVSPILHTNTNLFCLFIFTAYWNEYPITYIWSLLCISRMVVWVSRVSSVLRLPPRKCLVSGTVSKTASLKALGTTKRHKHNLMVHKRVHIQCMTGKTDRHKTASHVCIDLLVFFLDFA